MKKEIQFFISMLYSMVALVRAYFFNLCVPFLLNCTLFEIHENFILKDFSWLSSCINCIFVSPQTFTVVLKKKKIVKKDPCSIYQMARTHMIC